MTPPARLVELQIASPFVLELMASRDGDVSLERAIHRELDEHRLRGEWFRFCDHVVATFHNFTPAPVVRGERTHSQIVRDAGHSQVATLTNRPMATVRSWDQRDSIPSDLWLDVARAGYATLEELAAAATERTRPTRTEAA